MCALANLRKYNPLLPSQQEFLQRTPHKPYGFSSRWIGLNFRYIVLDILLIKSVHGHKVQKWTVFEILMIQCLKCGVRWFVTPKQFDLETVCQMRLFWCIQDVSFFEITLNCVIFYATPCIFLYFLILPKRVKKMFHKCWHSWVKTNFISLLNINSKIFPKYICLYLISII